MARMIEGQWEGSWRPADAEGDGSFRRKPSVFREPLPQGPIEAGRYHLFVAWTCPWAHRTLVVRALKGLQALIPVHFANELTDRSWAFESPEASPYGDHHLYQVYLRADPAYTGRVTVPVLWDSQTQRIVNNESSEIIAWLDSLPSAAPRLRPQRWLSEIDQWADALYEPLNNGVYRAGFASSQAAYDEAVAGVFACLDGVEARLEGRRWLVGDRITEADIRLFVTAFRFDGAYYSLFRCNLRRLADYPNIQAHLVRLFALPGVSETCNLAAARRGYASIRAVNPSGIVPAGPLGLVGVVGP